MTAEPIQHELGALRTVRLQRGMLGFEYDPDPKVQSTLACSMIPAGANVALLREVDGAYQASDHLVLVENHGKRWLVSHRQLEKATGMAYCPTPQGATKRQAGLS